MECRWQRDPRRPAVAGLERAVLGGNRRSGGERENGSSEAMTEREIFLEALEMPTPEARAAYLQGACGHDVTLRRKVEELLKEHLSNDSLLAGPALDGERPGIAEFPVEQAPAQMIGRYKLLEK